MTKEIKIPSPGESITEVEISEWLKADGDYVEVDEPLFEMESDKASLTVASDSNGILKIIAAAGETIDVGEIACTISEGDAKAAGAASTNTESGSAKAASPAEVSGDKNFPSPSAAKIMREKGVEPNSVVGSGKDGRITKADAMNAPALHSVASAGPAKSAANVRPDKPIVVKPTSGLGRQQDREPLSRLRKKLAQRLVAVKNETAMLTTFNEIDMTAVKAFRATHQESFKKRYGIKLGFMSIFTKACAEALMMFPKVNAQLDGDEMLTHEYTDIGIAVAAPKGLLVPVVRNAESHGIGTIEQMIQGLATKSRDGKLSIDEMQGGTFTITNGGVFGSLMSTPIINPPQSAILGMHNIVERPVVVDGKIAARPMMYVALSYDHRIIDGAESVQFLVKVKEFVEDPARMLLGV